MATRNKTSPPRPASVTSAAPLPGFAYTRERDERPYRLKALHEQHPTANGPALARLYEVQYSVQLRPASIGAALRKAGVRLREEQRQELRERPYRIVTLLATMPDATRDKLVAAYQTKYGIALPYDCVSTVLRQAGIKLIEPIRQPDRDEVEERPLRLFELVEQHPDLTYDQLGKKYEELYGVRLCPSIVGFALNQHDFYRHRLPDEEELAERPERLQALAEAHPDLGIPELAEEYERLYDVNLHIGTIQQALNRLGIYRMLPVDPAELAQRPERLRALSRQHPRWSCQDLAHEYERRYTVALSSDTVEQSLRSLGIYRQRPPDAEELAERSKRLQQLLREFPKLTEHQLAELYAERYGVTLQPALVNKALRKVGIFRQGKLNSEELKKRPGRLKKLHKSYPYFTYKQLAEEYQKLFNCSLTELVVNRVLNRLGLYRLEQPTPEIMEERVERLKIIARELPHLNKKDLFAEYGRRYDETLSESSTRSALRRRGVYQSRGEVARQRVERLLAIAAEYPDLSKAAIVREYNRRHGETLSVPSALLTLRRRGLLVER